MLGWRLDGRFANGDTPFYALPYIDLRGIPALRYQGEDGLMTEVEARTPHSRLPPDCRASRALARSRSSSATSL